MALLNDFNVLKRPVLTEKTTAGIESRNKYVFEVATSANKIQIKKAVEDQFGVKVVKVNTRWRRGKLKRLGRSYGRTNGAKQAVVTVERGDKIDVY